MSGPEEAVDLDEAALLVAAHGCPGLDIQRERGRLEELAAGCPEPSLESLLSYMYGDLGFRGNTDDYYDARNSFLNEVIARRLGIPISLAVVLIEVGRRVGLSLAGVGMPGHFLVAPTGAAGVYVDPFSGAVIGFADCEARFRQMNGPEATLEPSLLAPVGPRAIVARMLANLKRVYGAAGDSRGLAWALRLRSCVPGVPRSELAELAAAEAATGRFDRAASVVDELAGGTEGEAASELRARASALRARLN